MTTAADKTASEVFRLPPVSSFKSYFRMLDRDYKSKFHLIVEFSLLFVIFPFAMYELRLYLGRYVVPILLFTGLICSAALLRDERFNRRMLWKGQAFKANIARVLIRFLCFSSAFSYLIYAMRPDLFLSLPRENPGLWIAVMLLYPLLSVYPQEVIFRSFILHRYRPLFPTRFHFIISSALVFGLAHLMFNNWIAPMLSFCGGVFFASTYARSRSTLLASIEHTLWGNWIFTVGLGIYFYGAAIH